MMKQFRNIQTFFGVIFCMTILFNCRGNIIPSEEDLSDYGWTLYEAKDFAGARSWFTDAVKKDIAYYDGYNGMGWTMGQLRQPDSSIYYFGKYLSIDSVFVRDVTMDFYAGLAFAYNAVGNDTSARIYCNYLLSNINLLEGEDGLWSFTHNVKINYIDVRLILAVSEFRLGFFENCQESINQIYKDIGSPVVVDVDYSTVQGRAFLADHLVTLQKSIQDS